MREIPAEVYEAAARACLSVAPGSIRTVDPGTVKGMAQGNALLRTAVDSAYAAGVAAGRAQVLAALRDDPLYHRWNRECGMDPAGPRSTVDAVLRDVMHDFAEWATGGDPR